MAGCVEKLRNRKVSIDWAYRVLINRRERIELIKNIISEMRKQGLDPNNEEDLRGYLNKPNPYNSTRSKLRVIVEHTVSRIKKFGMMGTKFRNKLVRYDRASDIVSGSVNFRIIAKINPFKIRTMFLSKSYMCD